MTRKELYENKLQMDYFSDNYIRFEEDFQKYSAMNVPLTFLIDDILRTMAINQKNYFVLNKENAKDGREHRFYFRVEMEKRLYTDENLCLYGTASIEPVQVPEKCLNML